MLNMEKLYYGIKINCAYLPWEYNQQFFHFLHVTLWILDH